MSVSFGQTRGNAGPVGPIGDAGPVGNTGPIGPQIEQPYSHPSRDGLAYKADVRKTRWCSFAYCTTADSATSGVKYTNGATHFSDTNMTRPNTYHNFLQAIHFSAAQTTPIHISINYTVMNPSTGETWEATSPVYINGAVSSFVNPLLWRANSVILFSIGFSKAHFIAYLCEYGSSMQYQALPFYHYEYAPAESSLPSRPCFYHVKSDNGWYYCDGLA